MLEINLKTDFDAEEKKNAQKKSEAIPIKDVPGALGMLNIFGAKRIRKRVESLILRGGIRFRQWGYPYHQAKIDHRFRDVNDHFLSPLLFQQDGIEFSMEDIRAWKRKRKLFLAFLLSLFSYVTLYPFMFIPERETDTPSFTRAAEEGNGSTPDGHETPVEHPQEKEMAERVAFLKGEIEKGRRKIEEIENWISLQEEEEWRKVGGEKKASWQRYVEILEQRLEELHKFLPRR